MTVEILVDGLARGRMTWFIWLAAAFLAVGAVVLMADSDGYPERDMWDGVTPSPQLPK